jgi:hypothetical protein
VLKGMASHIYGRVPQVKTTVDGGLPDDLDMSNRERMLDWMQRSR